VIQKALKITFLVGEKYFSSWKNEKRHLGDIPDKIIPNASSYQPRLQALIRVLLFLLLKRRRKVNRGQEKRMNPNMKAFIKYLIVAVCSAIVTFLTSSCTAGLVIGKNQRQQQENNITTRADSSHFVPTITIR
jgi:hypothetical protein